MSKETIPLSDVAKVITDFTDKDSERAILILMLHGMKATNIRDLKINDLLNSCKSYFEDENVTLEKLLGKDPIAENMVAFWDIGEKPHFLCSSPQSLFFIFRHLQMRIDKDKLQFNQTDDYLLVNEYFTQLTKYYVSNWLNPNFRKELKDAGITAEITGRNLIYTFNEICNDKLSIYNNRLSTIKIFKGEKLTRKEDRAYYERILEDNNILINRYKDELLEYLTLDLDYDSLTPNTDTSDVSSDNDTNQSPTPNYTSKAYSNDEIRYIVKDYYKEHIQEGQIEDYDEYYSIIDYVYRAATYRNSQKYLSFDPERHLPTFFKNAQISLLFKNYDVNIEYGAFDTSDELFREVMKVIYESGASSIIPIVEDEFRDVFFSALFTYHKYELEYEVDFIITSIDIVEALRGYNW